MCLIVFSYRQSGHFPLILAANRDEFRARPATTLDFWADHPEVLAGRDLQAGGTWLGISRSGRLAALTNVRDPMRHNPELKSRGDLVLDALLDSALPPRNYADQLQATATDYNGYNLLFGSLAELWYFTNEDPKSARRLDPGLYGLSNEELNTPWPKVVRARAALAEQIRTADSGAPDLEPFFAMMADATPAPDDELPDTGIGLELERVVSPILIGSEKYGTRCTTVLMVGKDGQVRCSERSYATGGVSTGTVDREFQLELEGADV